MQPSDDPSFDEWVQRYLGQPLPGNLSGAIDVSSLPVESQDFIVRMLVLMQQSGFSVTEFTPHLIHWMSVTVPGTLPGAWGGRIPPLTLPGRHRQLDAYVADWATNTGLERGCFLDVGCGFPPVTTVDTAGCFTNWDVYGIDRSFAEYVLYDPEGHYACFDQAGHFLYFQALMNASGRALYADPQATRRQFSRHFADLQPLLNYADASHSESVNKNGHRLIHHHIRDFETDNLTLIRSDVQTLDVPPATVIRCMNVFIYYEPDIRKQMLTQIHDHVDEGGILIAGTNGLGVQTRYAVYRKTTDGMVVDEFAFGLDNVGHIVFMPFFSIHANDPEGILLAELTGVLRGDPDFGPDLGRRQDELLQQHGICQRNSEGFFVFSNADMSPAAYLKLNALIWTQLASEGFADRAVQSLSRNGYDAWKNAVGDIAIRPSN